MLKRLKTLREQHSFSQKTLAEKIGVSQQSINKYENHNIEPDIETLIRIASVFNTSVDYIIGNSPDCQPDNNDSVSLNDEELKLIQDHRRLGKEEQYSIQLIINNYNKLMTTTK